MIISVNELNNLENNLANLQSKGISFLEEDNGEIQCSYSQFKTLLNNSLPIIKRQYNNEIRYDFVSNWNDSTYIMYSYSGIAYGGSSGGNMWALH